MARVLVVLMIVGLVAFGCGPGEEAQPTGTETSERVEREATIAEGQVAEQQTQPTVAQQEVAEVVEAAQQQAEDQATQSQQIEQASEDEEEEPVDELPAEIVGVHKGVRSEGRVLGEPDAPVLIEHFGDFT